MSPSVGPTEVQIGHATRCTQNNKRRRGRPARPGPDAGPGPARGAGAGPDERPAAARYLVYILYYILDIFGYVRCGHPSGRKIIVKHIDRSINRTLPYINCYTEKARAACESGKLTGPKEDVCMELIIF